MGLCRDTRACVNDVIRRGAATPMRMPMMASVQSGGALPAGRAALIGTSGGQCAALRHLLAAAPHQPEPPYA